MTIAVRGLAKRFGGQPVLHGVDLDVTGGELVALLGPSGSGKTTLLRVIAGLEVPDTGTVVLGSGTEGSDRRVGFVFQHYALFRHMTVFENVAFGLRVKPRRERPAEAEIRRRVRDLLALVQLQDLEARRPSELSGGQRQRVALARALAIEPEVLLLDEPFGALDATVRRELRRWLRRLHETLHVTTLFVTHDQEEALEVADRLVVMRDGRIEQVGTPEEVYERPASAFVHRFLGDVTLFRGRAMRPHEIRLLVAAASADAIPATVRRVRPLGAVVRVALEAASAGASFEVDVAREHFHGLGIARGDRVFAEPLTPDSITG